MKHSAALRLPNTLKQARISPWWWRSPRAHLAIVSTVLLICALSSIVFWLINRPIEEQVAFETTNAAIRARYAAAASGRRSDWETLHSYLTDQALKSLEQIPSTDMAPLPIAYHPMRQSLIQASSASAVVQIDGAVDVSIPGSPTHTDVVREFIVLKRMGTDLKVAAWVYLAPPPAELRLIPAGRA